MKFFKYLFLAIAVVVIALIIWLAIAPPALVRVASNYAAKIVCSNVHLAGRDAQEVLKVDVQAPGHPILSYLDVETKGDEVRSSLFGLFAPALAVHRKGFGCTAVPDGDKAALPVLPTLETSSALSPDVLWPSGSAVEPVSNEKLAAVLNNEELQGPDMRAIVVIKDGKVVAERYGEGFSAKTPLLGWSMAKTVTGALVGALEKKGIVKRTDTGLFDEWKGDARKDISVANMLGMASSLTWNEGYGSVSDVTRVLYLEPDMAKFASKSLMDPADGSKRGEVFNYSSGTSTMISRYWQSKFDRPVDALSFPRQALFGPLGMSTAVFETDARGTLVGGSYIYASARDWARFGQFLLQKGIWEGQQILPEGYVDWMVEPHPAEGLEPLDPTRPKHVAGSYGRGHIWLRPPGAGRNGPDPEFNHKAWWLAGHDGQSVAIVPAENLVVVRMGLTPSKLGYKAATLTNAVIEALK